jgi:predicted fused transcriptional regulator/phosphomethylpyrimidine kinase
VIHFYSVALPRCRCGKPATKEIRASGNVKYGEVCDRCEAKRLRDLDRVHNPKRPEASA